MCEDESQVLRRETGMFGETRQHARSQLLVIVEGKSDVWPPITRKRTVGSRGPLDAPPKTEESRQNAPRLGYTGLQANCSYAHVTRLART